MTTRELAQHANRPLHDIMSAIRNGKIAKPSRNEFGHFIFSPAEVEAAVAALRIDRRLRANRVNRKATEASIP